LKLYVGQPVDITLVCKIVSGGLSLDDVVSVEIKFTKPDDSTGTWTGAWTLTSKTVTYSMAAATNDQAGEWLLQGELTFPASVVVPATTVKMLISERYT